MKEPRRHLLKRARVRPKSRETPPSPLRLVRPAGEGEGEAEKPSKASLPPLASGRGRG